MAAEVLLADAKADTVGREVSIRVVGSQTPPPKMTVQISITGTAKIQIQGRLHRKAPWADIGDKHEKSGLVYIDPITDLRVVSTETGADSSVSVWAAWGA